MRILIAGGGITGPALGVALARAGIGAHILEAKTEEQGLDGAFLALAPNGMNALRSIGLGDLVTAADGVPVPDLHFYNGRGRSIGKVDGSADQRVYGAASHLVRRGALHLELRDAAKSAGVEMTFGARLTGIEQSGEEVVVKLENGDVVRGDILLGCDGVHSTVRRLIMPSAPKPRYTGVLDCGTWTAVDLPAADGQHLVWGNRGFFGYVLNDGIAYWFSNVAQPGEPERGTFGDLDQAEWIQRLREVHADDPHPVPAILAAADSVRGVWPIYDLGKLETWHSGRVCLLGDAAHAASPSAGQGASLAIEDAVVLAQCLRDIGDPARSFAAFESLRKKRAEDVVSMGRRIGDRKVPSRGKALFRDFTLPLFLRMGTSLARQLHGYRIDWDARIDLAGAAR